VDQESLGKVITVVAIPVAAEGQELHVSMY